jgi:hypothetical protein
MLNEEELLLDYMESSYTGPYMLVIFPSLLYKFS